MADDNNKRMVKSRIRQPFRAKSPKEKLLSRSAINKIMIENTKTQLTNAGTQSKLHTIDQLYQNPHLQLNKTCSKNTLANFTYEILPENIGSYFLHGLRIEETHPHIASFIQNNKISYFDLCKTINDVTEMYEEKRKQLNFMMPLHEFMLKTIPKLLMIHLEQFIQR